MATKPAKGQKRIPGEGLFFGGFSGFRGKCFYFYQTTSKRLSPVSSAQASHCTSLTTA